MGAATLASVAYIPHSTSESYPSVSAGVCLSLRVSFLRVGMATGFLQDVANGYSVDVSLIKKVPIITETYF